MTIIKLPKRQYCTEHKTYFNLDILNCPLCKVPNATKVLKSPKEMKLNKHKSKHERYSYVSTGTLSKVKKETSNTVHEQSRTITNKSRRVIRKYNSGHVNSVSICNLEANSTSIGSVHEQKKLIFERFHSFRLKFAADVNWDALFQYEERSLNNNVKFKTLYFSNAIVRVFKRSILITLRKSKEIVGLDVKSANLKANSLINEVLQQLPSSIKVLDSGSRSSVHNAFVNHPFAKYDLNVKVNGETRLITDRSHGRLEFEAVHPIYAVSDSEAIERDNDALVNRGLDRDFFASMINSLVEDRKFWAEHQRSHVEAIQTLSSTVKDLRDTVVDASHTSLRGEGSSVCSRTSSSDLKRDKARKLLKDWGW